MPERTPPAPSLYSGARVVVVEAPHPPDSSLCEDLREMGHRPTTEGSAEAFLERVRPEEVDLVVVDADLPGMDGFALCRTLRGHPAWGAVPVVLARAGLSPADAARGLDGGAEDALRRPIDAVELRARLDRVLGARRADGPAVESGEAGAAFDESLDVLTRACELAEDGGGAHARRVGAYVGLLADALGLASPLALGLARAARLHDVGRLGISQAVAARRGPLTVQEFEVVKEHTTRGAEILGESPAFAAARQVAVGHHERWDGTGYPHGLAGEAIPLPARIALLADVYDALRRPRPYREPMDHGTAYRVITRGDWRTSPEHFDPSVLDAFARLHRRFEEVYATLQLSERP